MNSKEVLASLQLLIVVANANGVISEEERNGIQDALAGSTLPEEYTVDSLLSENMPLESILAVIQSEEARHQAFSAAYLLAYADGECSPAEKAILDDLQKRWSIPESEIIDLRNVIRISQGTVASSEEPIQTVHSENANDIIKRWRILTAICGASPIPILSEIAVLCMQISMVLKIGEIYGRRLDKASVKVLLATTGVGTGARVAASALAKFVPGWGSMVGVASAFITTHAIGKMAIKYFESDGTLSKEALKSLFNEEKAVGEKEYQFSKASIEANKELSDKITELGKRLKTNEITQEEYDTKVASLQVKI
jgi:uncharacterized protein (DUF697 family)